ncbi:PLP-dependent aminotransferase family protein [Neptunomonas antarctica]|uniref:Transcriptional regulator, GntR family n=1 Tax=Neptunomonas antarctica TaxID=619304 RepID=A0A1N7NFX0_9GAMM|nr:PLP-dependent aminotransferase family protein [Neptunomonas antarctica]SIS97182.1 transcriptional regulator, GntR family [Neptunomonas antarctica]
MSKQLSDDLFIPLSIQRDNDSQSKYAALYEHIKDAIFSNRLKPNEKLPSSRYLSKQMGISRNSVLTAYELLQAEGFLETRNGAGTYVAEIVDLKWLSGNTADSLSVHEAVSVSDLGQRIQAFQNSGSQDISSQEIDSQNKGSQKTAPNHPTTTPHLDDLFLPAQPAIECFPTKEWQVAMSRGLRDRRGYSEQPGMGVNLLREQVCNYLLLTRGVKCHPDQLMITSGSQQALAIALNLLVNADESVLLEDIGFKGIDGILAGVGAKPILVPTDEEGICFDPDNEAWQQSRTLIITPSRSFPLGHTLSLTRRLAILEWVYAVQGWIIEDDYDSEFIFDGHSIAALHGLDTQGRVIYTGTFSRSMFPGIRLGYMVLPEPLITLFKKYKHFVDGGLSSQQQMAMANFMLDGTYGRHLRRMRKLYKTKKAELDTLMHAALPRLSLVPSKGGMHSVYRLPDASFCDREICQNANDIGLGIRALSSYDRSLTSDNPSCSGLILGYAGAKINEMHVGVQHLQNIIESIGQKSK